MKHIYLASNSEARRKLLRNIGLKFKVIPGRAKEERSLKKLSCAELVKSNALKKAVSAARQIESGIIIAADTAIIDGKRVFGKPKSLKDARYILKRLSSKPHWLYTGLAVIDKSGKNLTSIVDYEKTKIYMDKLSDREISEYFKYNYVMDKAGAFDVQGKGAFFIRRIEGCFYNVVGLPLRRLYRMFKKLKINEMLFIFILFIGGIQIILSGCSTEYNIVTGKEETYYYSTDREEKLGEAIAKSVEKEYKLAEDPLLQQRVREIGNKIAAVCDRKDIEYTFRVLDDDEVNAVSLPGGFIYINKGLLEKVDNDNQLACVLAHEVGHVVARHSIKKLQALQGYSLLRILVAQAPQSGEVGAASDMAFTQLLLGYSREDELLADQLGARYARLAGYDPKGMIEFLEKLQEINKRKPLRPKSYFRTHPYVPDRIRIVKQELGEDLDFKDYINIEQLPHK